MDSLSPSATALVAGALFFALGGCATPSTPFEGHPVLKDIRFEGNKSISAGELESQMATAPTSGLFSKTPRYYDDDLFRIDEKRIVRWYNEKGFYEASIENVEVQTDEKGRVTLVVHIREGARARIKEVVFENTAGLTESEQSDVRKVLPLRQGDEFDEDRYEQGKGTLVNALKEHSFARAQVKGKVLVMPEERTATVTYLLDLGPRYKFGRVLVSGNRAVATEAILRAANIERGKPFKQSLLTLAQQRVYNLGAFSGVRVGLEPLGDNAVAAVRVNVREAPFQTLRFGLGLQAEPLLYEIPRLRAEYTHRNLFGGLRRIELVSQVGLAFTPTIANPAGPVTRTSAQLVTPGVLIPGLDFIVRSEFAREVQYGFSYDEVAGRVSFLYRLGPHAIAPSLNYVRYLNSALDTSLVVNQVNTGGTTAVALLSNCIPGCTLVYPELRYTFDLRDNIVEPHRGVYFTISLQQTIPPGTFTYFRIEPELRVYLPLSDSVVAAGRAYWGALVQPPGRNPLDSPFQQRFFGGGYTGNRGFGSEGESPRLGAQYNLQGFATNSVPIGGNGDFLLSGELRIGTDFLISHTAVVPFLDVSRITPDPQLPFSVPLDVAPGLGVRYLTPFGPIRLDVGYLVHAFDLVALPPGTGGLVQPVFPPPQQPTPVSTTCNSSLGNCISIPRFAFHLALGEAF